VELGVLSFGRVLDSSRKGGFSFATASWLMLILFNFLCMQIRVVAQGFSLAFSPGKANLLESNLNDGNSKLSFGHLGFLF
jgi:hypothetical protein